MGDNYRELSSDKSTSSEEVMTIFEEETRAWVTPDPDPTRPRLRTPRDDIMEWRERERIRRQQNPPSYHFLPIFRRRHHDYQKEKKMRRATLGMEPHQHRSSMFEIQPKKTIRRVKITEKDYTEENQG